MTPKKIAAGIATAGVLAGGGTIATDRAIDPYTVNGTTLEIVASSTLPEAGTDTFTADTTKPKITLSRFNGELNMGVTYDGMHASGGRPFLSENVEWKEGAQTMQVVPLQASSTMEDGGYEINIILDSKPSSNVFNFSIDNSNQLDFLYQMPLWQRAGLKAPTKDCNDTICTTDGTDSRPENVSGSYAVYYKDHTSHVKGHTNFATGKAYHIFRPIVSDANKATVWATLSYLNGVLTVTVPQDFLDTAAYPVKVDPTFGYTSQGATEFGASADQILCTLYPSASSGTSLDSMSGFIKAQNHKFIIASRSSANNGVILTNGIANSVAGPGVGAFTSSNFATPPTISVSTNYFLCDVGSATVFSLWHDFNTAGVEAMIPANNFTTPINPSGVQTDRKFSLFATYSAAAAASSQAPLPEF